MDATTLGDSQKSGKASICSPNRMSPAECIYLRKVCQSPLYDDSSRAKRDLLDFRIDVGNQLIGSFHYRQRAGQRTQNITTAESPAKSLVCTRDHKGVCIKRTKQQLTRSQLRHESHFKCYYCNVHLYISTDRDCFKRYHTKVEYWIYRFSLHMCLLVYFL